MAEPEVSEELMRMRAAAALAADLCLRRYRQSWRIMRIRVTLGREARATQSMDVHPDLAAVVAALSQAEQVRLSQMGRLRHTLPVVVVLADS